MLPLFRLLGLVGLALLMAPAQVAAIGLKLKAANRIPMMFHRGVMRIFGISVTTEGEMRTERPTLFVGNHISYLDIFVIGGVIEGSFVAKAEVAGWPVAGFLAKLQRTIFVQRERRASAGAQRDMLQRRLDEGVNVILFPEGTSHDGARVLPFKSALFAPAEREAGGRPIAVQPMSLAYVTMDGLPLTRAQRAAVAWYGDMGLLPHIWTFLKASRTQAVIRFHEPATIADHGNRRLLARACHEQVSDGVTNLVTGRPTAPAKALPGPSPQPSPQGEAEAVAATGATMTGP